MDGLNDLPLWLPLFADNLDRLQEHPFSTAAGCALLTCFIIFGGTFDLVNCVFFFSVEHRLALGFIVPGWLLYASRICLLQLAPFWDPRLFAHPGDETLTLRLVFEQYLQYLLDQSPDAITIRYSSDPNHKPAGTKLGFGGLQSGDLSAVRYSSKPSESLSIRVLDPAFYTRFVHYAHDFEAICDEMVKAKTIRVDRPGLLPRLFLKKAAGPVHASGLWDYVCFEAIRRWRRLPKPINRSMPPATGHSIQIEDIRGFRLSSMDAFVIQSTNPKVKWAYQKAVLRLFMADRLFLGSMRVQRLAELFFRGMTAAGCIRLLNPGG